ncbi:putative bifunctional diguanylate cyclase/phosphodiesterase [Erythrobacter sp.]|uniref:putative bifunctional diguanylate cyclase/phosphodiesterase n=1 Tax=Erythrobacter sp. TaxID=1042 RepID=UPI003C7718F7
MTLSGGSRLGRWAILCASIVAAMTCAQSGWLQTGENAQFAFVSTLSTSEASGDVHIVEVDAESIVAARTWPWPREHYANVIRRLDAAGVRSVVFDIDFSTPSNASDDEAFGRAISEAQATIVLPTFSQAASEGDGRRLDALPIAELRHNASLASASVRPDQDARVRRMVYGTVTNGLPRPSMSAQIAGASGEVDTSFLIDTGIAPASIPRHSFHEVEKGAFEADDLAGKDVIIGATAIELGDRYGVPVHGVTPGVTVQALAAETLMAGPFRELGWLPLLLLSAITAYFVTRQDTYRALLPSAAIAGLFALVAQIAAHHYARTALDVVPAFVLLLTATSGQALRIARRQLWRKGLVDVETGLPNALAFARADATNEQLIAAAYIKEFDAIQAVVGKAQVGALIERITDRLRSVAGIEEVYRADTRILVWVHRADHQQLAEKFEGISQLMQKPIEVAGRRIDVALAFGVASTQDLAAASRAASRASERGALWHAHEDAEAILAEQRVSLMGELDKAVENGELTVLYQPKLGLKSGEIESVEALVRWEHPERGHLRPDLFIPLAEETNRIEPLTLFVLRQTITTLETWHDRGLGLSAAVNISAKLIGSDGFVARARDIIEAARIPHDRIILEITESAAMAEPELAAQNLKKFRALGVAISMDDYGTGQSTLSYLQLLPLTELKIDRAFVQHAHRERSDALLVHSTIQLAHSLGLKVVGEGVEDGDCLAFLRKAGCDYAQGYYIAKPLRAEQLLEFVTEREAKAA